MHGAKIFFVTHALMTTKQIFQQLPVDKLIKYALSLKIIKTCACKRGLLFTRQLGSHQL